MLRSYLYQFGFRIDIQVLSVIGCLSAVGILTGVWFIIQSGKALTAVDDYSQFFTEGMFVSTTALTTFIFLFAYSDYYFILYYILCIVWIFPLIASILDRIHIDSLAQSRGILVVICTLSLLINGIANHLWLNDDIYFRQEYEGLSFQNNSIVSDLSGAVEFLQDNDLNVGYATFWHANILTEISNGEIRAVPVEIRKDFPVFYNWLTFKTVPSSHDGSAFLLLDPSEDMYTFESAPKVYDDGKYAIYLFDENEIHDKVFRPL